MNNQINRQPGGRALPNLDRGRAALFLQGVNMAIIKHAAARRQGCRARDGEGARGPIALGRAPMVTTVIVERSAGALAVVDGVPTVGTVMRPVTAFGERTAVRALARPLMGVDAAHPGMRAAEMIALSFERIEGVGGGSGEGNLHSGQQSDGGVTTKIKHVQRVRIIEAVANQWAIDPVHGRVDRGVERCLLAATRSTGNRQQIMAFYLLIAVCVEGQDLADILRAKGWRPDGRYTKILMIELWFMLGQIADELGL
jgi:hypothetical protein